MISEKNKTILIEVLSLVVIVFLMYFIGEIVLPFIFGILIAYLLNPLILKIQKKIRNRNLAISSFLLTLTLFFGGTIFFFGGHIVKDTKRLVGAVELFTEQNKEQIQEYKNSAVNFIDSVSENEWVQDQISSVDSLSQDSLQDDLVSTLGSVYGLLSGSSEDGGQVEPESKAATWSPLSMLIYTLLYTFLILFSYGYFEEKYKLYFGENRPVDSRFSGVWSDFKIVFISYFKQRGKIAVLNAAIFILAFSIMDLPGAVTIGVITGVLSFAAHFHYLSLPLAAIGCWVLSIEHDINFFIYFGIAILLYILLSILEETLYFNKILKSVNTMNTAITVLSFALWIYLFGGFKGTIIALPLTQLIIVYLDRIMLYRKEKRELIQESEE